MRSFIAIDFPTETVERIARVQAGLSVGRKVPPENLHLTLAFLGDQDVDALEALDAELSHLRAAPFRLDLAGVDLLDSETPDLLYLGARPVPELTALQAGVVSAVRRSGMRLPRRRFRPHVTLARFGHRFDPQLSAPLAAYLAQMAGLALPAVEITSFALFASELRADGARYAELARYPLEF